VCDALTRGHDGAGKNAPARIFPYGDD